MPNKNAEKHQTKMPKNAKQILKEGNIGVIM